MNDGTRFLLLVWAAIPCFSGLAIGLRYDIFALVAIGGATCLAFTVWVTVEAGVAFRREVWPQIKADVRKVLP